MGRQKEGRNAGKVANAIEPISRQRRRVAGKTISTMAIRYVLIVPMIVLVTLITRATLTFPVDVRTGRAQGVGASDAPAIGTALAAQADSWSDGGIAQVQQASSQNPGCAYQDDEGDTYSPLCGVEDLFRGFVVWFDDVFKGGSQGGI